MVLRDASASKNTLYMYEGHAYHANYAPHYMPIQKLLGFPTHLLEEASESGTLPAGNIFNTFPSWSENHLPNKDSAIPIDQLLSQRCLWEFRHWPQKSNEERLPSWPPEGEHINSGGAELSSRPPSHDLNSPRNALHWAKKTLLDLLLFLFFFGPLRKRKHKKIF